MGFMGFGKKKDFVDLSEHYRKQKEKLAEMRESARESQQENSYSDLTQQNSSSDSGSANGFGFFANMASAGISNSPPADYGGSSESVGGSVNPEERKRVLNKKLSTITEKLEDLSNDIYHLQQRIEVLERKSGVGRY